MICVDTLKKIFNEKLAKTQSMDAAFTKAVWAAYLQGIKDGSTANDAAVKLNTPKTPL